MIVDGRFPRWTVPASDGDEAWRQPAIVATGVRAKGAAHRASGCVSDARARAARERYSAALIFPPVAVRRTYSPNLVPCRQPTRHVCSRTQGLTRIGVPKQCQPLQALLERTSPGTVPQDLPSRNSV